MRFVVQAWEVCLPLHCALSLLNCSDRAYCTDLDSFCVKVLRLLRHGTWLRLSIIMPLTIREAKLA